MIIIQDLHIRHPGVSKGIACSYYEATQVCLDRHHLPPAAFVIERNSQNLEASIKWDSPDAQIKRAWANDIDATEAAAYCLALAAIEATDGMVAVGRAETMTGADYYLAGAAASTDDLEGCYRLEVSGIDKGDRDAVDRRLRIKLAQAARGRSNLPAIASIVAFSAKLVVTENLLQ